MTFALGQGGLGPVSKKSEPAFRWREVCDGWTLLESENLHVIQERMPPGTAELLHVHEEVRQLYFVLDGEATVDVGTGRVLLQAWDAIAIAPGRPHRMTNRSSRALEFLVVSSSAPRVDRRDLE